MGTVIPLFSPLGAEEPALSPEDQLLASSDNALLAACAAGDRRAFSVLMRRHLRWTLLLADRIVLNRTEAHDIVQDAFLRVWRFAADWDPEGPATFSSWLRRIVVNLAISRRRRWKPEVGIEVLEELPAPDPSGYETSLALSQKQALRVALSKLSARQRGALGLFYFEGLSHKESAAVLGIGLKAFESLLVRAREKVKNTLLRTLRPEDLL